MPLKSPRFAGDPVLERCLAKKDKLKIGSKGPAVEKVQKALIDLQIPLSRFGVGFVELGPAALEARGARFQVGDADDVLVGHPEGQVPRRFRGELRIAREERLHAFLEETCVGFSLVVLQAGNSQIQNFLQPLGSLGRRDAG